MNFTKMPTEKQTIVFKLDTLSHELAVRGIQSVLRELCVPFEGFKLYGRTIGFAGGSAATQANQAEKHSNIIGDSFEF